MATQAISFITFLILYAFLMKAVFKVNLEPLAKLDISKVDRLKDIPDTFNRKQKIIMAIIGACVAYIIICTLLPKTIPYYDKITGFGSTWIWVIAAMFCSAVRPKGSKEGFLPMGRLLSQSSLWVMISLIGALMILGEVTSNADLGVRTWLINLLGPLFGNMNIWGLMAAVVIFATVVTQVANGLVLTMAICPVITPFVCEMAKTTGINPSVILTVVNCCANVAYLTVAGSVNAAYLFARPEITQKFIWTKGVIVTCIYMVWQYIIGMILTFVF